MSFGQELREFVGAFKAGDEIAHKSRQTAMQGKYYEANARSLDARARYYDRLGDDEAGASAAYKRGHDGAIDEGVPAKPTVTPSGNDSPPSAPAPAPTAAASASSDDPLDLHVHYLVDKGKLDPKIASAMAGNIMQESSGNAGLVGDNGKSIGLYQFHDGVGRRPVFDKWATDNKRDPKTYDAQHDFAIYDLKTNHPQVYKGMEDAPDPESAAEVFATGYERPKAESANMDRRRSEARRVFDVYSNRAGKAASSAADAGAIPAG